MKAHTWDRTPVRGPPPDRWPGPAPRLTSVDCVPFSPSISQSPPARWLDCDITEGGALACTLGMAPSSPDRRLDGVIVPCGDCTEPEAILLFSPLPLAKLSTRLLGAVPPPIVFCCPCPCLLVALRVAILRGLRQCYATWQGFAAADSLVSQ